ncbi:MAG: cytidine deaminase [bacterium]|nr:cytidine deaminase [bacterium]
MTVEQVIQKAIDALEYSYVPYSKFHVAAALVAKNGDIYTGVNVENASYPATNCAERTAFFKAVSEGVKEFEYIVIVGGMNGKVTSYCSPCGICRQVMREFCDKETFRVIIAKSPSDYREFTLEELLPLSFGPEDLV